MRKFTVLMMFMALMLTALAPAFAQDAPGTIADIVVASTQAEMPEFTTLLTAVQAADLVGALADPEAQLTVFAPTDAAFAALAEALGPEAFNAVLADTEMLTSILLFHVVEGKVMSGDVVAGLEAGSGLLQVPSLQGQYIDITQNDMGGIAINGAPLNLGMVDIEASNGVIHVIDAVITPETPTIAEVVVAAATNADAPQFTTLLAAVQAAGLAEVLADPEAEFTVFAPTDAAFAALAEALGADAFNAILADPEALGAILLYHVVPGRVYSADLAAAFEMDSMSMMDTPAWLGEVMDGMFQVKTVNGAPAVIGMGDMGLMINEANIIAANIDASNGVIHVIDTVIVPPTE